MLFSQRKGLKPIKNIIQTGSMDEDLRNRLWNVLDIFCWSRAKDNDNQGYSLKHSNLYQLLLSLWHNYFKEPLDTMDSEWTDVYQEIRTKYYEFGWDDVYDFIEFIAQNDKNLEKNTFVKGCNVVLEQECSAYRFINDEITQITTKEEISEIEEALAKAEPIRGVRTHLKSALEKLSDRKIPDYRNSIKESISAVESLVNIMTEQKNNTLGQALKCLESKGLKLHGALQTAFSNLYGYTSAEGGIRHGLMDDPSITFSDAKFMMVSCSAFVNYLIDKAEKAGIKIKQTGV